MKKEREITIKVIQNNRVSKRRLAQFFAMKYTEETKDSSKEKS